MELTREHLKRAATEARGLSMDCLNGTAPRLIRNLLCDGTDYCVMGLLGKRAVNNHHMMHGLPDAVSDAVRVTVSANNEAVPEDRHAAVVFPLLWLADELDAASEQPAAQAPSSAIPDKEKGP